MRGLKLFWSDFVKTRIKEACFISDHFYIKIVKYCLVGVNYMAERWGVLYILDRLNFVSIRFFDVL